ncbi:unnamed protein product [Cylindrotheca closterium]|uniref:Plant heme peroxidase family profile domain-containing protein n=1 Tax=Cylindrotheca closterium TaxID=2856 RepID=A0AAD2FJI8_9STRA|nr:unnamed protein product [Cylindrotheca closterium]
MQFSLWHASLSALALSRSSFLQQSSSALLSLASPPPLHILEPPPPPPTTTTPTTTTTATATAAPRTGRVIIARATSNDGDSQIASVAKAFRNDIQTIVKNDPSLAGPLIRLAFHDAATWESSRGSTSSSSSNPYFWLRQQPSGGPNGSIQYELGRSENRGLSKPLQFVQNITHGYAASLSLADAIALAGASAVEAIGGPTIAIRMGRIDATQADPEFLRTPLKASTRRSIVTKTLPEAGLDSDGLRLYFGQLGFSEKEFVALCGCHGLGRHVSLLGMPKDCLRNLTRTCLEEAPVLLPFVTKSVDTFDNSYFQFLLKWNSNDIKLGDVAFIPTDVDLVVDTGLKRWVDYFAQDQNAYFNAYGQAYQKLVDRTATTQERY